MAVHAKGMRYCPSCWQKKLALALCFSSVFLSRSLALRYGSTASVMSPCWRTFSICGVKLERKGEEGEERRGEEGGGTRRRGGMEGGSEEGGGKEGGREGGRERKEQRCADIQ